jgi:hypothetical protein
MGPVSALPCTLISRESAEETSGDLHVVDASVMDELLAVARARQ